MTRYLLVLFLANWILGCSSEQSFTVEFCDTLTADERCSTDRDQFNIGDSVFVQLSANLPFDAREITGRIMRLTDEDSKIELGVRKFNIEPGMSHLTQNLPFHSFGLQALGTFSIEFSDENNQLLTKRTLTIEK